MRNGSDGREVLVSGTGCLVSSPCPWAIPNPGTYGLCRRVTAWYLERVSISSIKLTLRSIGRTWRLSGVSWLASSKGRIKMSERPFDCCAVAGAFLRYRGGELLTLTTYYQVGGNVNIADKRTNRDAPRGILSRKQHLHTLPPEMSLERRKQS